MGRYKIFIEVEEESIVELDLFLFFHDRKIDDWRMVNVIVNINHIELK